MFAQQAHLTVVDQELDLLLGEASPIGHQVGPPLHGADEGLGPAPAVHPAVVPGQERGRHLPAPEIGGAGVLGILEKSG